MVRPIWGPILSSVASSLGDGLAPIQRTSAAQAVADRIVALIGDGTLRPGDQLPTERELAERLGVGRSSIREALQMLATLNLVEARPGAGTFVRRLEPGDVVRAETLTLLAADSAALELLEAREMIEPQLARLAAIRATDADLERIRALLDAHARAIADRLPVVEYGARFHLLVAEAAHNRIAHGFMISILGPLTARGRRSEADLSVARREHAEHVDLLRLISDRDPDAAAREMKDHIVRWTWMYDAGPPPDRPRPALRP